jgi:hypothetical protein
VKVCSPSAKTGESKDPELQGLGDPASRAHVNVELALLDKNSNEGELSFVGPVGPESSVVSGGLASTVNDRDAFETLPAPSVART